MFQVFVVELFELIEVALAVDAVSLAHGFLEASLFGPKGITSFGAVYLTDGGVDVADTALVVLGDLDALGAELEAQRIDSFFKFVHNCVGLAVNNNFRQKNGCHIRFAKTYTSQRFRESYDMDMTALSCDVWA